MMDNMKERIKRIRLGCFVKDWYQEPTEGFEIPMVITPVIVSPTGRERRRERRKMERKRRN